MLTLIQSPEFSALVVDDAPVARRMVSFALAQSGFARETAVDGEHAVRLLGEGPYDLLITDLRMPNKNGHALAVGIIGGQSRPAIIVHTSVEDPRLAKDLLARGDDDCRFFSAVNSAANS